MTASRLTMRRSRKIAARAAPRARTRQRERPLGSLEGQRLFQDGEAAEYIVLAQQKEAPQTERRTPAVESGKFRFQLVVAHDREGHIVLPVARYFHRSQSAKREGAAMRRQS